MSLSWRMGTSWETRSLVGLAGLFASCTAAVTLSPLVEGTAWFGETFMIMALIVGTGIALRRFTRWDLLVLLGQMVVTAALITALHAADTAIFGVLPGPQTWNVLEPMWREGMTACRQDTPPVEESAGLLLVLHCGLAAVTLAVDAVAVCLRRPAAAGLPLLAVYCVPAAALSDGLPWYLFVPAAVGYLLLIGSDSRDRILGWGRVLDPADSPSAEAGNSLREVLRRRSPLSGAKRVGTVSVLMALLLPAAVPGLDGQMFGSRQDDRDRNNTIHFVDPFLDLRANLNSRSEDVVIRYTTTASHTEPLRLMTLDHFDGTTFMPTTGEISRSQRVQDGLPSPPGLSGKIDAPRRTVKVEISGSLSQPYLPLPYPTSRLEISGDWLYDERTLDVIGDGQKSNGAHYTAEYYEVSPTIQQLEQSGRPDSTQFERYLALPQNLPETIKTMARQVAQGGTPHQQASRLQNWFRDSGDFVYTDRAPEPRSGDAIAGFLAQRHGYCAHFASAMALMARSLGIPSRVAIGFLPGQEKNGHYEVRMTDAHAWPELFFEGVGWTRFEPTPSSRTGSPPQWTTTPVLPRPSASPQPSTDPSATEDEPQPETPDPQASLDIPSDSSEPAWYTNIPWLWILTPLLIVLVFLAPSLFVNLIRRHRLRRCAQGAARAEAIWSDFLGRLADLHILFGNVWTPHSVREKLSDGLGPEAREALDRLVDDLEKARYVPDPPKGRDREPMAADVILVTQALAATRPQTVRLRARWFPTVRTTAGTGGTAGTCTATRSGTATRGEVPDEAGHSKRQ